MKKLELLLLTAALISTIVVSTPAIHASTPVGTELVWANGVQVTMTIPPSPEPIAANTLAQENFYEEAPQTSTPQSTDGAHVGLPGLIVPHDHTIPAPAGNRGTYVVVWHVFLLFKPGSIVPSCFASATSMENCLSPPVNGTPLTSVSAVQAAASLGLVMEIDTGVTFICPITTPLQ